MKLSILKVENDEDCFAFGCLAFIPTSFFSFVVEKRTINTIASTKKL